MLISLLDENEFSEMVRAISDTEKLLGKVSFDVSENIKKNRKFARSLFIVEDMKEGDIITKINMISIRPGNGMHPKYYNEVLGKKISQDIKRGTPLVYEFIVK